MLPTPLAPLLTLALLTGSAPLPGVHACARARHTIEQFWNPSQEVQETCFNSGPGTSLLLASPLRPEANEPLPTNPNHPRESPHEESNLTDLALSKMTGKGDVSVRDIKGSVTWNPEKGVLLRLNSYRRAYPRDSSQTHVMLQVELTPPRPHHAWRIAEVSLGCANQRLVTTIWSGPAAPDAGLRFLLEADVDARRLNTSTELHLMFEEDGALRETVIGNITFP